MFARHRAPYVVSCSFHPFIDVCKVLPHLHHGQRVWRAATLCPSAHKLVWPAFLGRLSLCLCQHDFSQACHGLLARVHTVQRILAEEARKARRAGAAVFQISMRPKHLEQKVERTPSWAYPHSGALMSRKRSTENSDPAVTHHHNTGFHSGVCSNCNQPQNSCTSVNMNLHHLHSQRLTPAGQRCPPNDGAVPAECPMLAYSGNSASGQSQQRRGISRHLCG